MGLVLVRVGTPAPTVHEKAYIKVLTQNTRNSTNPMLK